MAYTSRYDGPELTVEESTAAASVFDYGTVRATNYDWTPAVCLWRSYCDWWAANRWRYDPNSPPKLTRRQFGRAVRRLFPSVRRRKRSFQGRPQWGYAGLIGPESVVTPPARRPITTAMV